jgi:5-methylcytosine-specific restriction enzyme A
MARANFRERGYVGAWDELAADYKQRHPWCIACWSAGIQRPTEIVDHIVPVADDPERLLDPSNLQPCCRDCHDRIKRVLERQWRAGKIKAADLDLRSDAAYVLRRKLHRPRIGPDGYPIEEGFEVRSIPSRGAG